MPDNPSAPWLVVLGLASLSLATSWIGAELALRIGDRPRAVAAGIGFSAGTMIVISAAELIPEAYRAAGIPTVVIGTGLGAGLLATLHVVIPHMHLAEYAGDDTPVRLSSAYLVATGLILHDFSEGLRPGQLLHRQPRHRRPRRRGHRRAQHPRGVRHGRARRRPAPAQVPDRRGRRVGPRRAHRCPHRAHRRRALPLAQTPRSSPSPPGR
jgi:ZIP family zinc transporter